MQMWLFGHAPIQAEEGDLVIVRGDGAGVATETEVIAWLRARGYRVGTAKRRGSTTSPADPKERKRLSRQCRTLLSMFVAAGPVGIWNDRLAEVSLKYTSRISDLRGAGYVVDLVERGQGGRRRYVLRNPPDELTASAG